MLRISMATLFALLVATAAAPDASAQDGDKKPDYAAAKAHYNAAETAAAEGRWKDAAREYGIAHEITKDPVLFFKLGNAYDKDGDCASALTFFGRYLSEAKPSADFEKLTRQKIATCEEKVAEGEGEGAGEGEGEGAGAGEGAGEGATDGSLTPTFDDPLGEDLDDEPPMRTDPLIDPATDGQPSWQRTAAWISVGAAVAFGVTGGVLGLAAGSREDDIQADIDFRDGSSDLPARFQGVAAERYDDLVSQGKKLELAAFLSFGAAGVAICAATAFFIIDPGPQREGGTLTIAPAAGPGQVGVLAGWSFE